MFRCIGSCSSLESINEPGHNVSYKSVCGPIEDSDQLAHLYSESSLCILGIAKDPTHLHMDTEDYGQTAQKSRLIGVFTGHMCNIVWNAVLGHRLLRCSFSTVFWCAS